MKLINFEGYTINPRKFCFMHIEERKISYDVASNNVIEKEYILKIHMASLASIINLSYDSLDACKMAREVLEKKLRNT